MYSGMAMMPNPKPKPPAAPKRKAIDLLMDHAKRHPAKKPPPVRHWDAMPGTLVTEDLIRSMREDELHRDIFSTEERARAFRAAQAGHMWARENNAGYPDHHGLYVFSAKMGEGKSLLMESIALAAWMYHAVPVFSPTSAGLLFGYRIELEQLYQVSDVVPQGSIIVLDEVAALADNFGGQAMRSRTLGATMTAFRKEGLLILAGSAAEWNIAPALKIAAEAIVTPKVYRPTKEVVVDYDDHYEPITETYYKRKNELDYPSFCYMKADALVTPWERRRVREDFEHEKWKASSQSCLEWKG